MAGPDVHTPVLLNEVLGLLGIRRGHRVLDATIDGGGHTSAMLDLLGPAGAVLGIDRDPTLVAAVRNRLRDAVAAGRLVIATGNFRDLGRIAAEHGFARVNAVLFDLGMSSFHIDQGDRGFRFSHDEPLDMRFDRTDTATRTAADILATANAPELTDLFRDYGQERFASRIARSIVATRERRPITTTGQLFDLIARVLPGRGRAWAGRSAARVFQALRIAVNDELDAIREALPQAVELLAPGGRLGVIAFHSLEDRIVKHFLVDARRTGSVTVLTKRPIRPSDAEVIANPRASSAKLRVAEKVL